jgi:hypothetical protein
MFSSIASVLVMIYWAVDPPSAVLYLLLLLLLLLLYLRPFKRLNVDMDKHGVTYHAMRHQREARAGFCESRGGEYRRAENVVGGAYRRDESGGKVRRTEEQTYSTRDRTKNQ